MTFFSLLKYWCTYLLWGGKVFHDRIKPSDNVIDMGNVWRAYYIKKTFLLFFCFGRKMDSCRTGNVWTVLRILNAACAQWNIKKNENEGKWFRQRNAHNLHSSLRAWHCPLLSLEFFPLREIAAQKRENCSCSQNAKIWKREGLIEMIPNRKRNNDDEERKQENK